MLCALFVVHVSTDVASGTVLRVQAKMAEMFFLAVSGTQLALVLFAAPAATAGAICLDRARGTIVAHADDRSFGRRDRAGQAGGAVGSGGGAAGVLLPVMELLTLLGGVDPTALLGGFAVSLGVAVLGCSLAMFFSLWVGKTHEALMGTYAIWSLWLLGPADDRPGREQDWAGSGSSPARTADPFFLALAPYWWPGSVAAGDYFWFLGATLRFRLSWLGLQCCGCDRFACERRWRSRAASRRESDHLTSGGGFTESFRG